MCRSCLEVYMAKLFSDSVYNESVHISVYCNYLIDLCRRVSPQYIRSNRILKTSLLQERSNKILELLPGISALH